MLNRQKKRVSPLRGTLYCFYVVRSGLWPARVWLAFYHGYIYGLLALLVAAYFKLDILTLGQRLETIGYDACVVNENLATLVGQDKTVALLAVEPFNFACHRSVF